MYVAWCHPISNAVASQLQISKRSNYIRCVASTMEIRQTVWNSNYRTDILTRVLHASGYIRAQACAFSTWKYRESRTIDFESRKWKVKHFSNLCTFQCAPHTLMLDSCQFWERVFRCECDIGFNQIIATLPHIIILCSCTNIPSNNEMEETDRRDR